MNKTNKNQTSVNDVAIIGMGLRFPKSNSLDEFWTHLKAGRSLISEVDPKRWDKRKYYGNPRKGGNKTNSIWAGFLEDADCFDADFFNISPREAETMDPQQRMTLELAWQAIEDAGYRASDLAGTNTGVFMGVCHWDYAELLEKDVKSVDAYLPTGTAYSIIPNRVSYFYDLKGPSIANDTACASSLVSIYEAVKAIQNGECKSALAGGVNLCWSPKHFIAFSKNGMLSKEGKSKAFDNDADGYVRGEGGAMLLLKSLDEAIENKDDIYAVIKGIGTNHGGRTSSLTVTNPRAQANLVTSIYQKANVSPDTVSYIEAHGPGTPVGDPIEIHGLKTAFEQLRATSSKKLREATCGIGSVKTNIGHLEGAAGIAGVIKVIAAMKHRILPTTVNFKQLNFLINLKESPFYIVGKSQPWAPSDENNKPIVRRAGVSSFGFGGSNAHILLEEYIPKEEIAPKKSISKKNESYAFPFSAKNKERLLVYIAKIHSFLDHCSNDEAPSPSSDFSLSQLAYTLQLGREPMSERVIFTTQKRNELIRLLKAYLDGEETPTQCWQGNAHQIKEKSSPIFDKEDLKEITHKWLKNGRIDKISSLWSYGATIDWEVLYNGNFPKKMRLPGYPFARVKHWYTTTKSKEKSQTAYKLHPLIHSNTSTLHDCHFTSIFDGDEFFLADHIIKGKAILPGVASMEMAREAVALALGLPSNEACIQLRDVLWMMPIAVQSTVLKLRTKLYPKGNEWVRFELSIENEKDKTEIACCKGEARAHRTTKEILDFDGHLKAGNYVAYDNSFCYEIIRKTDQLHGERLQGIRQLYLDEKQALVRITLPKSVQDTLQNFVLHPTMMDSVMHASILLLLGPSQVNSSVDSLEAAIPFSMDSISLLASCKSDMWAWLRYAEGSNPEDLIRQLDMDVCDEFGNLCVRIKGYSARILSKHTLISSTGLPHTAITSGGFSSEKGFDKTIPEGKLIYTTHQWIKKDLNRATVNDSTSFESKVVFIGYDHGYIESLKAIVEQSITLIGPSPTSLGKESICTLFQDVYEYIQQILLSRPKTGQQLLMILPESKGNFLYAAISALVATAKLENPKITGKVILLPLSSRNDKQFVRNIIKNETAENNNDTSIRYGHRNSREVSTLTRSDLASENPETPLIKQNGVYLITGGAGGLGKKFARHIANTPNVTVILNGRSSLDAERKNLLEQLQRQGAQAQYFQASVGKKAEVVQMIAQLLKQHGKIDGILHCSGVVKDAYIMTKTLGDIPSVFIPKVDGIFHLDEATKDLSLDFIALFSSIAVHGNSGQADYAGANAVLDAFAAYRNKLSTEGERSGKTLAINWPLWQSGGMQVDEATQQQMYKSKGLMPLPEKEGIRSFFHAMSLSKENHIGVLYGNPEKIGRELSAPATPRIIQATAPITQSKAEVPYPELKKHASLYLKNVLGKALKVDPNKILADQQLVEYGLNSIVIIDVTSDLEEHFGPLSKTLFFEYIDVQGVAAYLAEEHKEKLIEVLGLATPTVAEVLPKVPVPLPNSSALTKDLSSIDSVDRIERSVKQEQDFVTHQTDYHDIAIIGVGGKYPEANSMEEFWSVLSQGRDCFKKVPTERWQHDELYFNERDVLGKSTIKTGAFIDDIDKFDPRYFSISQRQAELMSPEVRLFLQVGVEAFEDAGYSKEYMQRKYQGDIGVLVGTMSNHYYLYGVQNMLTRGSVANGSYTGAIPNMLSYYYGFTGPSIFLDTMCSGSSTCIHQAVQMLRAKECKMVIAGGISLLLHPYHFISSSQEHYTTKTGEVIRSYGLGADGTILGEGVGAVVLKPLVDAQRDGDHIYGVIKGSGLSNAGIRNGFTVPNPHNQALAVEKAIKDADIDPRTISYVEGHGSGTALGDPIEIKGLGMAFKKYTQDRQFCPIGSVKSNIAHLLGAAGVAGLTKVLLQFKHKKLVPSLHAEESNPHIDFAKTPFYINKKLNDWSVSTDEYGDEHIAVPRRAGITSIGAGGMNSHIIVDEYVPENKIIPIPSERQLFIFSAMNKGVLKAYLIQFGNFVSTHPDEGLAEMAFTLQVGKNELPCRLTIVADSTSVLLQQIEASLTIIESHEGQDRDTSSYINFVPSLMDRSPQDDRDEGDTYLANKDLEALGHYWVNGGKVDWELMHAGKTPRRISLPKYPFEKVRCWYTVYKDAPTMENPTAISSRIHPFLGKNISGLEGLTYRSSVQLDELLDYVYTYQGIQRIIPSFIIDIAFAIAKLSGSASGFEINDMLWVGMQDWQEPSNLIVKGEKSQQGDIQLSLSTEGIAEGAHHILAKAILRRRSTPRTTGPSTVRHTIRGAGQKIDSQLLYEGLAEKKVNYRPYLEGISKLWLCQDGEVVIKVVAPDTRQYGRGHNITAAPITLGAMVQGVHFWAKAQGLAHWEQFQPQTLYSAWMTETDQAIEYLSMQLTHRDGNISVDVAIIDKNERIIGQFVQWSFATKNQYIPERVPLVAKSFESTHHQKQDISTDSSVSLEGFLKEQLSLILKFGSSEIDTNTSFSDYGFDSITLAKLAMQINHSLSTDISPTLFFQCSNIRELAEYIHNHYRVEENSNLVRSNTGPSPITGADSKRSDLWQKLTHILTEEVASIVKFDIESIDMHTHFQDFGFESITLASLSKSINGKLKLTLTPPLFFECRNISELVIYLIAHHEKELRLVLKDSSRPEQARAEPSIAKQKINIEHSPQNPAIAPTSKAPHKRPMPVAIIGMAGRFPQSNDLEQFWDNIQNGKDLISDFPLERYDGHYREIVNKADFPKKAGILDQVDRFDATFFNISPAEAELMDPQQRLALETTWKAMEDAGYTPDKLPENTGVYFGVTGKDYEDLLNAHDVPTDAFTATGNSHAMLANRISYYLDIHGPSEPVDTACSSSLVAIHKAVQSLSSGMCDMNIVGGVNLLLSVDDFIGPHRGGMLSPDGACKTFSKAANGYVRGEGVGVVLLKPLEQAERDGDNILGVIVGSAVNHGGRASSLTAPNALSQAKLVEKAIGDLDPNTISYIETHGTGTALGDPVEINGLKLAFENLHAHNPSGTEQNYCGLGSVKSNIGHLEAAAGVAGLCKVLLSMKHKTLPKSLHTEETNPYIKLENSPFYIVKEKQSWTIAKEKENNPTPRRSSISSFGFGGSNAHIVIEEYIKTSKKASVDTTQLFVFSAKGKTQLVQITKQMDQYLANNGDDIDLQDISYTLMTGRLPMKERLAIIANSIQELRKGLTAYSEGHTENPGLFTGSAKKSYTKTAAPKENEHLQWRVLMSNKAYDQLARAWTNGSDINWDELFEHRKSQRVRLPSYPFAKDRYWIPKAVSSVESKKDSQIDDDYKNTSNGNASANGYYDKLIEALVNNTISAEEAIELAKNHN